MKRIIVLVGRWSHECREVEKFWKERIKKLPATLEIIDVDSDRGMNLMDEFEVSSVPVTIIDDEVIFIGMPDITRAEEIFNEKL
ncbi:MAG: thioredoxin family protein [bacterium]|nr:thioredoxin family protein [bacterium]